jgi:nucleoside-diphosphate-sugar epimerase
MILVTGAAGFLGAAVIQKLLASGNTNLRCFLRPGSDRSRIERLRESYPDAQIDTCVGNLLSKTDAQSATQGVSLVYHLAASARGSPADIFLNTVVASKNLLEAAVVGGCRRVVLVSSFGVYETATLPRRTVVTETTPLEAHPRRRDAYSHAKWRQELLCREYAQRYGFELAVVRPGVIYGPGGAAFSLRVGLSLQGVLLHVGRANLLPLSYVDNCADAVVLAGLADAAAGQTYNVVDDDPPTCSWYLREYKRRVKKIPSLTVPYWSMMVFSALIEKYSAYSRGQLPPLLTSYRAAVLWKGQRFDNTKLKSLGWKQGVARSEGLRRTFDYLRATMS